MEWVETTGKTVDEAKDTALDQLGVDEDDAEFEVLEEPRLGLFGRLRAEARVRARVRPTTPRPKEERRDRRKKRPPADGTTTTTAGSARATAAVTPGVTPPDQRPASSGGRTRSRAAVPAATPDVEESTPGPSRSRRGRTTRPERAAAADASTGAEEDGDRQPATAVDRLTDGGAGMDVPLDTQGEVAREFLDGLMRAMHLEAAIDIVHPDEDTVEVSLQGADLGLLIGPKGTTLLALQDLTRTVVQRKTSASNGRLFVDIGSYRQKRKAALERFVQGLAAEVIATNTRKVLEPMTAADRKVVHDAANDIQGVETTSEGEEPQRRVVLYPAGG